MALDPPVDVVLPPHVVGVDDDADRRRGRSARDAQRLARLHTTERSAANIGCSGSMPSRTPRSAA
jgi:hypothetical protein